MRGVNPGPIPSDLVRYLDMVELYWLERALTQTGGNKSAAARLVGLRYRSFSWRLEQRRVQFALAMPDPEKVRAWYEALPKCYDLRCVRCGARRGKGRR